MMNLNTPIWQLTVGEFIDLQRRYVPTLAVQPEAVKAEKRFVYGIQGLAELLSCSKVTAQKIKNSGVIDKATSQFGRKIAIDAELALQLIHKSTVKHK